MRFDHKIFSKKILTMKPLIYKNWLFKTSQHFLIIQQHEFKMSASE